MSDKTADMPKNLGTQFFESLGRSCLTLEIETYSGEASDDLKGGFLLGFMHGVTQSWRMIGESSHISMEAYKTVLELMRLADTAWDLEGHFDIATPLALAKAIVESQKAKKQ